MSGPRNLEVTGWTSILHQPSLKTIVDENDTIPVALVHRSR